MSTDAQPTAANVQLEPVVIQPVIQQQQQQPQHQQQHQQQPQPMTSRTGMETARTARAPSRSTLQPTVQDFNGNIINKAVDDDQVVWMLGKSHTKYFPSTATSDLYAFPVPASFRASGAFSPPLDISTHTGRLPHVAALNRQDRTTAWSEEVHRRHVARTARVRQCLSPKQRRMDRVIGLPASTPVPNPGGHQSVSLGGMAYTDSDSTFSLSIPISNGDSHHHLDDARLTTTSLSRSSSRNDNLGGGTSRARPASTGRYFDTSNGLRNLRSNPVVLRSRPTTATPWAGPGLKIKKVVLHQKEFMMI